MPRLLGSVLLALFLALLPTSAVVLGASPAAAHGLGGVESTNVASRVVDMSPRIAGLRVRVIDLGTRVEVRNDTERDVLVLGYDGEPYLRVGPSGAFRNARSPATFWNRSLEPREDLPAGYDANAEPEWDRIGTGRAVRWHDHRTHWMGGGRPGGGSRAGTRWTIHLVQGGQAITVRGEMVWVPAPSPALPLLVGAAAAFAIIAFARTRRWPAALAATLTALVAAVATHTIGEWGALNASPWTRLIAGAYSLGGIAAGLLALSRLLRPGRDPYDATPWALAAGVVLLVTGGLAALPDLARSQLPTTLPGPLDRLLVGLVLGLGAGAVVTSAIRLRRPAPAADALVLL